MLDVDEASRKLGVGSHTVPAGRVQRHLATSLCAKRSGASDSMYFEAHYSWGIKKRSCFIQQLAESVYASIGGMTV